MGRHLGNPVLSTLSAEVLARIDAAFVDPAHGDLVERDPGKVASPFAVMPAWKA